MTRKELCPTFFPPLPTCLHTPPTFLPFSDNISGTSFGNSLSAQQKFAQWLRTGSIFNMNNKRKQQAGFSDTWYPRGHFRNLECRYYIAQCSNCLLLLKVRKATKVAMRNWPRFLALFPFNCPLLTSFPGLSAIKHAKVEFSTRCNKLHDPDFGELTHDTLSNFLRDPFYGSITKLVLVWQGTTAV